MSSGNDSIHLLQIPYFMCIWELLPSYVRGCGLLTIVKFVLTWRADRLRKSRVLLNGISNEITVSTRKTECQCWVWKGCYDWLSRTGSVGLHLLLLGESWAYRLRNTRSKSGLGVKGCCVCQCWREVNSSQASETEDSVGQVRGTCLSGCRSAWHLRC